MKYPIEDFIKKYNEANSFSEALRLTRLDAVTFRNLVARVLRKEARDNKVYLLKFHSRVKDKFNTRFRGVIPHE